MEDFFIVSDIGYLGEDSKTSSDIFRIRVSDENKKIVDKMKIGTEIVKELVPKKGKNNKNEFSEVEKEIDVFAEIKNGYGVDRKSSIEDFIRRNSSAVIEGVFNAY